MQIGAIASTEFVNLPMTGRPLSTLMILPLLCACAAMQPGYDPQLGKVAEKPNIDVGTMEGSTYRMSETEKNLDCKKILGSMQITISRMKDQAERPPPSSLSTSMKGALAPIMGGSTFNSDPAAEVQRDKAKLQAYNQALRAKGCNTLDIEAELAKPAEGPKRY